MKFQVALLQLLPGSSVQDNMKIGLEACKKAKAMGANLALFPEMWSCGYEIPEDPASLQAQAIPDDGSFVSAFSAVAKELEMAVAITFLDQFEPLPRNTVCVFDRFGRRILQYAKVHTCDFGDERRLLPGEDFYTADLDTGCEL